MKSLEKNSRLLVEQILDGKFLDANSTLASLITEAEENREEDINNSMDDDTADTDENAADENTTDVGSEGEQINTDGIDEPTDGSPTLGDSLDQNIEDDGDQSVGEGEMTEMSNDVVEINCEVNQKIISKLYDKISNLKTILNTNDMDHDTREYITLETKLSYYGNKLEELQSKTNPAIDQSKVEKRINIIEAALKSLESEIGGTDEVSDVESSAELTDDEGGEGGDETASAEEGNVDELGDNAETVNNAEDTEGAEGSEGEATEGEEGAEGSAQ